MTGTHHVRWRLCETCREPFPSWEPPGRPGPKPKHCSKPCRQRAYYRRHAERICARTDRWREENREQYNAAQRVRKRRQRARGSV